MWVYVTEIRTLKDRFSILIERFQRNIEAYRSPAYNETQLRIEFIDPFFEALGWDVTNKAGYAEQYKDVPKQYAWSAVLMRWIGRSTGWYMICMV